MPSSIASGTHVRAFVASLFAATVAPMTGCDGSPSAADEDIEGVVSDNHGHVAVITVNELNSGDAVPLDITVAADHSHTLELTADEVGTILEGDQVSKESSLDNVDGSHSHLVTFN